ncbi:unnamed protein product [Mytilus edulis]|uniref:Uncharacterized protein n=1 Tax=Mytilus edulis TaxID=6550 RepID=A0A8S3QSU4_MYTED|nr:unnamed protein product [Mytilus edulis]
MFVMTEDDLKYNNENRYERVGIVIPDVLLQDYIERLFDHLLKDYRVEVFIDDCRPLMNDAFRIELRNYLNLLNAEQIGVFIYTGSISFFNTMFVMSGVDINECDQNISKRFGIIIPGNLVQQYLQKWFEYLLDPTTYVSGFINYCRPLRNYAFRTALHTYMNSFTKEQITFLIQNGSTNFLNTMFVMTKDDIRHDTKNRYDCFGFVLSGDLLQQYIEKWFDKLTNHYRIDEFINTCRPLMNFAFKTALRSYIGILNTESIDTLIQNGSKEFFNKMFVTSENDFKDDPNNIYECIGIVIPDDLLHQYIGRWFEELKKRRKISDIFKRKQTFTKCYISQCIAYLHDTKQR